MTTSNQLADEGFGSILDRGHMGPGRFFNDSLVLSHSPVRSLPGKSTWVSLPCSLVSHLSFSVNDFSKEKLHLDLG